MNILLLEPEEVASSRAMLGPRDPRAAHVREVLGKGAGGQLRAGIIGRGECMATILPAGDGGIALELGALSPCAALPPLVLVLGLPRPIQLGRILKDLSSLGLARILMVRTELGEKSYMDATIFEGDGIRKALVEGAVQAGSAALPVATRYWTLGRALEDLGRVAAELAVEQIAGTTFAGDSCIPERIALDNVEPEGAFPDCAFSGRPIVLAVGSERGWSPAERTLLREAGFTLRSLGTRILKTETAALVSCAIARERMGEYACTETTK